MAKYSILIINTLERFHTGAGETIGIIDNVLIREKITGYPFIQGSTIKGVLRDDFKAKQINNDYVLVLFGPEPTHGEDYAGAVSFGDAYLLAFPIRSLKGSFVWATSPLILNRFFERLKISKIEILSLNKLINKLHSNLNKTLICAQSGDLLLFKREFLLLEEYSLNAEACKELSEFAKELSERLFSTDEGYLKTQLQNKLVILPEEIFAYFVENATEIIPNIRIDDKGTTKEGSLRYTEFLPQETILYSLITFEKSRKPDNELNEDQVKGLIDGHIKGNAIIQFGGDKTIGKGLVKLKIWE